MISLRVKPEEKRGGVGGYLIYTHWSALEEHTVWRLTQGFTRHLPLAHQPHIARACHVEEAGSLVHGSSVLLTGSQRVGEDKGLCLVCVPMRRTFLGVLYLSLLGTYLCHYWCKLSFKYYTKYMKNSRRINTKLNSFFFGQISSWTLGRCGVNSAPSGTLFVVTISPGGQDDDSGLQLFCLQQQGS